MVSHIERGLRPLPLTAALPQAALTLAYQQTPPDPTPEAPEAPDAAVLRRHQRTCEHRAAQLTYELTLLPERATWARRRLAALPVLRAALVPAPAWLARFEAEARAELGRSGSTAQAQLRIRRAGLLAEAAEAERLLVAAGA